MKNCTLLPLFIFITSLLHAQVGTQTVRGIMIDKETKTSIQNAIITIVNGTNTWKGKSNSSGEFQVDSVEIGRFSIGIVSKSYDPYAQKDLVINAAKEVVLNVELNATISMGAININIRKKDPSKTNNDMVAVSGRQFNSDQTQRYAGSLMDPSRMAANFAGVSGGGGQRNDIIVRGNSPTGLLWRLEGIDIPNPNHFSSQGATGGPVSILNNNNLANSDFLSSAFPAEYGNAVGAVFDLKMRNGNYRTHEFTGQVGFNGFEFGAEGPIHRKKRSSYSINYRYSTLGAFEALGIDLTFAGIPKYQDVTARFNFPKTKTGEWTLTAIGGNSSISLLHSKKDSADLTFGFGAPNDLNNGSAMLATILSNTQKINNGYLKFIGAYTYESRFTQFDTIAPDNSKFQTYAENSNISKFLFHGLLNKRISPRLTFRAGLMANYQNASVKDSVWSDSFQVYTNLRDFSGNTLKHQAYAQLKYRFNAKWSVNGGLHHQYLYLNNSASLEPRLALQYKMSRKATFSAGYGNHAQQQATEIYFTETYNSTNGTYQRTNENLGLTNSDHFVLGYDQLVGKNFRLKAEAYYQKIKDVPVRPNEAFSVINLGADFGGLPAVDNLKNRGEGTNYGIELTLEKFFSKHFYYLITTSIYDSKFIGGDGKERNTAFNSNYVVNALGGYEWVLGKNKNQVLGINLKVTRAGGRRYTAIDIAESNRIGTTEYDEANPDGEQFKEYFRTDFKISYKLIFKKITQEWAIDIQNFFDTQNPLTASFNRDTGGVRIENQQGRLPMFFYRIQF